MNLLKRFLFLSTCRLYFIWVLHEICMEKVLQELFRVHFLGTHTIQTVTKYIWMQLYYKQPSPKQQSDISQSLFTLWVVLQQLYTYIRKIKRPKFFSHNLDILQNHPYFGISVLFCQFPFLLNMIRPLNHSKISLSLTVH